MMAVFDLPTDPEFKHLLGRSIVNHDPRNRLFAAMEQDLKQPQKVPGSVWWTGDVFDQVDSNCTMEACVGLHRTNPFRGLWRPKGSDLGPWVRYDSETERVDAYHESQDYDPWLGRDYDGTSTDAPFKLLKARGDSPGYHWLFGESHLWDWVRNYGPAVVGTTWTYDMFRPRNGYLKPTGGTAGGHAWRVVQAQGERNAYRMVNSWGRRWGEQGRAWITRDDMGELLADFGEAVTIASVVW
jgi:hypothetical protein